MSALTFRILRRSYRARDYEHASRIYTRQRDASGLGSSKFPAAVVHRDGKPVAHISYNGRVWAYDAADPYDRRCNALCLYDPRPGPGAGALPPERMAA